MKECPNTAYSKLFDHEALIMLSYITLYFGSYLGFYFDVKYNKKGDFDSWIDENHKERIDFDISIKQIFKKIYLILFSNLFT